MAKYQIIYWRDIPVQVRVSQGRERLSKLLSPRFQQSVYRAAYRAKAINGQAYIEEWRPSEWQIMDGDLEKIASLVITDLEGSYSDKRLDKLARNKGFETNDS